MYNNVVRGAGFISERHRANMILEAASKLFGIPRDRITSKFGSQRLVEARRMCCYAIRTHTTMTYQEISDFLGGRHHSTLIHLFRSAESYIDLYMDYRSDYERLIKEYKNLLMEGQND